MERAKQLSYPTPPFNSTFKFHKKINYKTRLQKIAVGEKRNKIFDLFNNDRTKDTFQTFRFFKSYFLGATNGYNLLRNSTQLL